MPTVTVCATPVKRQSHGPGATALQRSFGRSFGDVYQAGTLLRGAGVGYVDAYADEYTEEVVWSLVTTPTMHQVAAASLVLQGGHVHNVSDETIAEIEAAGLCVATYTDGSESAGGYAPTYSSSYSS